MFYIFNWSILIATNRNIVGKGYWLWEKKVKDMKYILQKNNLSIEYK